METLKIKKLRFTDEEVKSLRRLYARLRKKKSIRSFTIDLCDMYNCHQTTLYRMISSSTYKHLPSVNDYAKETLQD